MQLCIVCGKRWNACLCAKRQRQESLLRLQMMSDLVSSLRQDLTALRLGLDHELEVMRYVAKETDVEAKESEIVHSNGSEGSPSK